MKTALFLGAALIAGLVQSSARAVTLVHTNDILGELEPCGCRSNPLGGMAREYHLLQKMPDTQRILLDGGDLLFQTQVVPELLKKQSELQARYLLKAMDQLHYDAVVIGEKDLALGLPIFRNLKKDSSIHFLAANLHVSGQVSGKSPFENHIILNRKAADGKTLRVGIFGVTGTDLKWPKGVKASSPIAAAKQEVAYLKKHADLVIALSHLGLDEDKKLATQVKGIDIIVGGHTQSFLQTPIQLGSTWIYQSSFRNQYVGVVPLKKPFTSENYELVGLDASLDSPADAPSAMDSLVKDFKTAIAQLNSAEEVNQEATFNTPAKDTYQTFPRCAECHLKQFEFWRKTAHANALTALVDKDQFLNKDCLTCHTVGAGKLGGWSTVKQLAEAKEIPSSKPDDSNPDAPDKDEVLGTPDLIAYLKAVHTADTYKSMVKLHAVSKPDEAAMPLKRSLNLLTRSWTPVQCENCHQPGGDHPFAGGYSKKVDNQVCLSCHTAERAPDWWDHGKPKADLIENKRKSVTCPAGDLEDTE